MPSFTIHIITAKEYIRKHPDEIINEKEFIEGTIDPDISYNKSISHYGIWENYICETHLDEMINDEKVNLMQDYWKGYFFHLYVDNQFYNYYFVDEWKEVIENNDKLFRDYYLLNNYLVPDYNLNINEYSETIKEKLQPSIIKEEPKYINYEKLKNMIDEVTDINIDDEIERIKRGGYDQS